jgi:hypothetical protein
MPKGLEKPRSPVIARKAAAEEEGGDDPRLPEIGGDEEVTRFGPHESLNDPPQPAVRPPNNDEEDRPLAPLRHQTEEEEAVQTVRRQEEEEEEALQAVRRQAEEEEEEALQTVRRQAEEEEEPIQALQRQEPEPEEMVRPMRPIARQEEVPLEETRQTVPPETQANLEPDAGLASQELAGEEEPSEMQALRRNLSPGLAPPPQSALTAHAMADPPTSSQPLAESFISHPSQVLTGLDGIAAADATPQPIGSEDRRPQVIIDQVDVLIHESSPPADRRLSRRTRDRAMRARYLRRL